MRAEETPPFLVLSASEVGLYYFDQEGIGNSGKVATYFLTAFSGRAIESTRKQAPKQFSELGSVLRCLHPVGKGVVLGCNWTWGVITITIGCCKESKGKHELLAVFT